MLDKICTPVVDNAAELAENNQEEFRKIRQNGLGASDSSVVLGVNPFPDNTEPELIKQKIKDEPTAVEKKIQNLVSVKKGRDLEPIILQKFKDKFDIHVFKPEAMYQVDSHPYLKINYDGLIVKPNQHEIPVEVKLITKYGAKYYDMDMTVNELGGAPFLPKVHALKDDEYIKNVAKQLGIPVYYYTQIQQQLLGTGAPYAYLVGLVETKWEIKVWQIPRNQRTIEALKMRGFKVWQKIKQLKEE
jgi:hypothetical protein